MRKLRVTAHVRYDKQSRNPIPVNPFPRYVRFVRRRERERERKSISERQYKRRYPRFDPLCLEF